MKIYIIRHGESMATRDPTLFAHTDPRKVPLTQWGYEQAIDTGRILEELYANTPELQGRRLRIYHSPHTRIAQSKDGFLQGIKNQFISSIQEDPLLREREHGRFDGLDEEAQRNLHPDIYEKLHSQNSYERYTTQMPDGESIKDVQNRLRNFIAKMTKEVSPGEDAVIITHGGNCRALEDNLTHYDAEWPSDFIPPGTGDIIQVDTTLKEPGTSKIIHEGKKRMASMPQDYKAAAYDSGMRL